MTLKAPPPIARRRDAMAVCVALLGYPHAGAFAYGEASLLVLKRDMYVALVWGPGVDTGRAPEVA
eukprot:1839603-Alexandrium_andersonii.AAC.1